MSEKRDQLVQTAERLFYREGFYATGVDRVIAEAGVARMTLYKHFRSKDELVLAVLERRDQAYWFALTAAVEEARRHRRSKVLSVFEAHGQWLTGEGRHGCLFMKALGEYAGHSPRIVEAAVAHKRRVLTFIRELILDDGVSDDKRLEESLAMLLEGATAYAQILAPEQAALQARLAAEALIEGYIEANGRST